MDLPTNWADPLARIPDIPSHPSISEETILKEYSQRVPSLSPSEIPSNSLELRAQATTILSQYQPANSTDNTSTLLEAFMEHLPANGQHVLLSEIVSFATMPESLRSLRDFLFDTILKPSMAFRFPHPS